MKAHLKVVLIICQNVKELLDTLFHYGSVGWSKHFLRLRHICQPHWPILLNKYLCIITNENHETTGNLSTTNYCYRFAFWLWIAFCTSTNMQMKVCVLIDDYVSQYICLTLTSNILLILLMKHFTLYMYFHSKGSKARWVMFTITGENVTVWHHPSGNQR